MINKLVVKQLYSKLTVTPALIALAATLLSSGCGSRTAVNINANTETQLVDVKTSLAVVRPIPTYFEATGNLASDASTDVAPSVGGKIAEVNFDVGSFVS